MRKYLVALACLIGAALFAPDAAASTLWQPPAAAEEAPVDPYAAPERTCRRLYQRRGRGLMSGARCRDDESTAASYQDGGLSSCASHYGYRGHRRAALRRQTCRPLFSQA
jgi:hypothetical protein